MAERQAARLLRHFGIVTEPVPDQVITELPSVRVRYVQARHFVATAKWSTAQRRWLILVNRDGNTAGRIRWSLMHEAKHAVDHPLAKIIYRDRPAASAYLQAERAADAFAAALLMPKAWVKRAFYGEGIRDERILARRFGVSVAAMRVRIDELGLLEPEAVA
ncbi:MAG: ImmA/IrrE family metallo-endopeptidase [Solirubrobacterales bacterium]